MNGSAQNVGARKKRSHATLAVAPVTRAIRAALAVSATALALSVPVVGLAAGPCSYDTASNTHACIGGFNQSIFNQTSLAVADANLVPPVDLTVVPGDQLPSSVTADAAGIDAVWASDFSIFTDAGTSIDTSSAVGAMDVGSVDDVTLVDGGDAFADATRIHDAITAHAFSLSGDISTDNHLDGTLALGYGTLEIGDEGVINADSINDGASDIVATAVNNLTIDNGSDISVSGYGNVFGLDVVDAYTARLNNSADISAEAGVGAGYWGTGAYATAVRINSMDAIVCNYGGISATATADGYYARARGVDSFGYSVGSTVYNAGDINASAQADGGVARATGVYSFGYAGSSSVDNAGDIHASAQADGGRAYASAINSVAYGYSGGLDTSITNSGKLSANADADLAYAITIFNIATGRYGNAYVTNTDEGKIYAEANGDFTTATAVINQATRYGSAVTSNAGGIYATANGTSGGASFGISNYSQGYAATVDNSGSISATSTSAGIALATGVENESVFNTATFYNSGSISASADSGTGMAAAWGVTNTSEQVSSLTNEVDGDIDVVAHSQDGYALAVGAYALGGLTTTLTNYGSISARSSSVNGDATAYAAVVNGGYAGIGLLINGGDLNADASTAARRCDCHRRVRVRGRGHHLQRRHLHRHRLRWRRSYRDGPGGLRRLLGHLQLRRCHRHGQCERGRRHRRGHRRRCASAMPARRSTTPATCTRPPRPVTSRHGGRRRRHVDGQLPERLRDQHRVAQCRSLRVQRHRHWHGQRSPLHRRRHHHQQRRHQRGRERRADRPGDGRLQLRLRLRLGRRQQRFDPGDRGQHLLRCQGHRRPGREPLRLRRCSGHQHRHDRRECQRQRGLRVRPGALVGRRGAGWAQCHGRYPQRGYDFGLLLRQRRLQLPLCLRRLREKHRRHSPKSSTTATSTPPPASAPIAVMPTPTA